MGRLDAGVGAADKCGVLLGRYRVVSTAGDSRANGMLVAAHNEIQNTRANVDDPQQREAFLSRAMHQELLAAWAWCRWARR